MLFRCIRLKRLLPLVLLTLLPVCAVQAKQQTQSFSLPPVDDKPFTLQIPFQVSATGVISANVRLNLVGLLSDKTLYVSLHRKNHRYPLEAKYFDARTSGLHLRHEVEEKDLAAGQDYYLSLVNYSRDKTLSGEVELNFPMAGEIKTVSGGGPLPNLAVGKMFLDEHCTVQVTMKNLGPGPLPKYFWKKNMPELKLSKDGQEWGGVDIRFFDYNQALSPVGGEIIYNSGLKVIGSARIRAEVVANPGLREADTKDNAQELVLTCE